MKIAIPGMRIVHGQTLVWLISGFHSTDRFEKISFKKYNENRQNSETIQQFLSDHISQKNRYEWVGGVLQLTCTWKSDNPLEPYFYFSQLSQLSEQSINHSITQILSRVPKNPTRRRMRNKRSSAPSNHLVHANVRVPRRFRYPQIA